VRRRAFIALIGGAAVVGPARARAQQRAKVATIGFLGPATPSVASNLVAAFVDRLSELGWVEGRNLTIEYRWAEGQSERYAKIASEFVALKVDLIVTWATAPVLAAKQATGAIPIVFAAQMDPVSVGVVASLSRPGGKRYRSLASADRHYQ
jgi:putative ABC transport system substrate-binding protein